MNWFELGILNGFLKAKKAEVLESDWITLRRTSTGTDGEYTHQGLQEGIYAVQWGVSGEYSPFRFFIISTGTYAHNDIPIEKPSSTTITYYDYGIYLDTSIIRFYSSGRPIQTADTVKVKKIA